MGPVPVVSLIEMIAFGVIRPSGTAENLYGCSGM